MNILEFDHILMQVKMFQLLDLVFTFPEFKFPTVPSCVNGTCDGKLTSVTEFHCTEGVCESKVRHTRIVQMSKQPLLKLCIYERYFAGTVSG